MDAKRQSAGGRRQSNPLISLQRKEVDSPEKGLAVPGVEPNGFRASTSNLVSSSSSNLQSNQKPDNRASLPMTEEPETTDDQPTNLPPQTPPSNATVFPSSKGGKPMGFEDDDATWERFQKNNKPIAVPATSNSVPANMVSPAQSRSNRLPSVNVSRLASLNQGQNQAASSSQNQSSTAPSKELKKSLFADTASNSSNKADVSSGNSAKSNNSPISGSMPNDSSFFSRNKKSGLAKDWLPISSIWTQKKSLAREDVQVTLFAIADILASSNIPTSFAALKRQQAANDDSFNFRQQLTTDTSTPLRLFEIADRIASGGLIDAEADFPVIGWFLKLVAACPNMCMDEVELDEPTSQTVGNKSTEEPGLNRIVGSGANEASKLKIEADDILAVTFAKVEVDAAKASAVHEGSNTLKGDVTISIIEDAIEQALAGAGSSVAASSPPPTEVGSFAVRSTITGFNGQYRLHIKDEYDGLYVIPASPTMTINEIKQEALRRYGIVDFINRHDIFGVDSYNNDVQLDHLNVQIGSLRRLANNHMQFRLRRKKPISWSIPILIHSKGTYRHISVDAFTTVEQVTSIVASLENVELGAMDDFVMYNGRDLIPPCSTFDPWDKAQEYAFSSRAKPFQDFAEQPLPEIRPKPLEAPQEPTFKQSSKLDTSSKQLPIGTDAPKQQKTTFKSRLFGGFGVKNTKDDEEDEMEDVHTSMRPSSNIAPNRANSMGPSNAGKSAGSLPNVPAGDFFVTRFYYGNMAYTTLRLQTNATAGAAIISIMDKVLIKESPEEYSIFVSKNVEGVSELDRSQELYPIHKNLQEGEIFLFQRKTKIAANLRPEKTESPYQSQGLGADSQTTEDANIPKIICVDNDMDDVDGGGARNHRPSLSKRLSKSVEFLQRKTGLRKWTKSEEAKELCRILALVGKPGEITSELLKPKKMSYQASPKEGWLVIRDEYEEWVDVWVSVNGTEVKLLLSSLDATTYIIPTNHVSVHMRNGPEIGNMRHTFVISDSGSKSCYTMGAKSFSDMEEWVERIKSYAKGPGAQTQTGSSAGSDGPADDTTPFQVCRVLGEGETQQVLLCKQKTTKQAYAVKILPKKLNPPTKESSASLEMEYKVLRTVKNPFIIKLHAAFESASQIFLITDYIDGGELYFQISNFGKFTEERARFYAAEILLGLECLHGHRIVYRDLKLENILLNRDGHVVISDFGLSRMEPTTDAGMVVGPLEYLAPEVIYGQGSSYASDWWSFGIILYEMMCGHHPFYSEDRSQMETNILSATLKLPKHLSVHAKAIITGLLAREPAQRLGINGGEEILRHAFFSKIDPVKLANREVEPPYKPEIADEKEAQLYDDVKEVSESED